MQIDKLQVLFRKIRESQGISQTMLAKAVGKTQGAITQFELMRASLSDDTLKKMAPTLNLNPDYIEKKTGNPFRCSNRQKLIKMYISENPSGELDFSLIEFIAEINEKASFYFLKPSMLHLKSQRFALHSAYAVLVEDVDENVFIFRKKRADDFFNYFKLRQHLTDLTGKEGKIFEIKFLSILEPLYKKITNWNELTAEEFSHFLTISEAREKRELLIKLINKMIFLEADSDYREKLATVRKNFSKMDDQELDDLFLRLIPKLLEVTKRL